MGGACKKTKAHKTPPEYTITEDETDLVAQMVQDRTTKDFDEAQCQRDRTFRMRKLLSQTEE
jgi:hypothetical protein